MESVFSDFLKPSFWVVTVLVARLVNLLSAYIKTPIDNFLSSISTRWKNRTLASHAIWQKRITDIATNAEERAHQRHSETSDRLKGVHLFCFAIVYFLLGVLVRLIGTDPEVMRLKELILIVGMALTFYAIKYSNKANETRKALNEAHKLIKLT